jgi:hypothetical protein
MKITDAAMLNEIEAALDGMLTSALDCNGYAIKDEYLAQLVALARDGLRFRAASVGGVKADEEAAKEQG